MLMPTTPADGRSNEHVPLALILVLVLTLIAAGCAQGTQIYEARTSPDGKVVLLKVAACLAELEVEVDEGPDEVVVRVMASNAPAGDFDCAGSVYFGLSEPLGNRVLVDASTGDAVPVRVSETVTSVP